MRSSGEYTSLDTFNLIQISSILVLSAVLLSYGKFFTSLKNQSVNFFIIMLILGIFSGIWSKNFFYSSYRAFEAYTLLIACLTISEYRSVSFEVTEKYILRLLFFVGIFSLFGLLLRRNTISLATLHSNGYTISGAILASYSFGALFESEVYNHRKKIMKRYFFSGLFLLVLGTSLGSVLSFIAAISAVLLFSKKNFNYFSILIIIIVCLTLAYINNAVIMDLVFINKTSDELSTLNGRTLLWEMYLNMIYEKPFLGWGYDIISRESTGVYATNSHFFLISILGGLGLLGLSIFLISGIKLTKELIMYNSHKYPGCLAFIASLTAAFVNGGSKGYIGEHVYSETVSFFLVFAFFSICFKNFKREIRTKL